MGLHLFPDDIQPGMYVTIHSKITQPDRESEGHPFGRVFRRPADEDLPAPPGFPLQVQGVSFPFIFCAVLKPGGGFIGPAVVDVRTAQMCKVDDSYIEAIATFSTQLPDDPAAETADQEADAGHEASEDLDDSPS
jgi:hypothetical protein